jgi:hypothetical protein
MKISLNNGDRRFRSAFERRTGTLERRFMQTPAFLWYELEAAKRHVKEALDEPLPSDQQNLPDEVEAPAKSMETAAEDNLYRTKINLICHQPNC